MHVCFPHGGAIRGFAKNMKAMSLKARAGGGGGCRARSTRRGRRPRDCKDGSGGAESASAKIAPAQLLQDDGRPADHQLRSEEEQKQGGGGGGGGKKQEYCDKCCSPLLDDDDDDGAAAVAKEWVAEPEPGVMMTLAPRPDGTNRLRRVRFREELFDAWAAQSWWADNSDRIVELYSVVQSSSDDDAAAAAMPVTPCHSEEEEDGTNTGAEPASPSTSTSNFSGEPSSGSHNGSGGTAGSPVLGLVTAPDNTRSGSKKQPTAATSQHHDDDYDVYDGGEQQPRMTPWREWAEEYEPGVFITVRAYPGHPQPLQLRHVELSRERFGEVKARVWWQENKDRLRSLYSF